MDHPAPAIMQLRHVELIQAILATGSLTQAAARLHITQPAASKLLAHAETQLGFKLFERIRGRLRATREADILAPELDRLARNLEGVQRLARNLRRHPSGHLRVGCAPSLGLGLLPQAIRLNRERHPDITFSVRTQHTAELVEALLARELDIALSFEPPTPPGIAAQAVGESRLVLVEAADAAGNAGPVSLANLPSDALIGLDAQDPLGGLLHQALGREAPEAGSLQVQTHYVACALAAAGCGAAVVDAYTAHAMVRPGLRIRPLAPALTFRLNALMLASDAPSALLRGFLVSVRQACAEAPDSIAIAAPD
ncbi:LysR family transcriptional regulator [plant metagenome]|uniref:LysR family transcriptional regulator n=2 Tax=plant metagenome TaxID=1297885 RepID=A0A484RLQ9_9ZZZZ